MRRVAFGALATALLVGAGCGGNPIEPSGPDLDGEWRGYAAIGMGAAAPLVMNLDDQGGRITGTGGGADCKYFLYCSSLGSFSVTGSHDERRVRLFGTSIYGPTWTMEGTISGDTMSGLVAGTDMPQGTWQLTRRR